MLLTGGCGGVLPVLGSPGLGKQRPQPGRPSPSLARLPHQGTHAPAHTHSPPTPLPGRAALVSLPGARLGLQPHSALLVPRTPCGLGVCMAPLGHPEGPEGGHTEGQLWPQPGEEWGLS